MHVYTTNDGGINHLQYSNNTLKLLEILNKQDGMNDNGTCGSCVGDT